MKKRIVSLFLAAVMVLTFVPMTAMASNIKVTINGSQVQFDQPPVIKDGRTLVPLRAIFEAMGCTVLWDSANKIVNVATEFGMMTLGIGSNYISYRNENEDRSIVTDVPPQIIGGRTLVPVRAIAECTGYNVDWNAATQTVAITGEIKGLTIPTANIPGYYTDTKTPDFGKCFDIACDKVENGKYTYSGVKGRQVVEYIETYLASAGFLIDSENEAFNMFVFVCSNSKTLETVRVTYFSESKTLYVALSNG